MIKRIVEVSRAGTHLSITLGQLVVKAPVEGGDIHERQEVGRIPCEDIGVLLVWHTGVSYTHSVFTELLKHGAAVILCDGHYLPAGMLLPLESNTVQTERFRCQIEAKEPVKKQLWRQIVRAKIAHQADVVKDNEAASRYLRGLREQVRSGDPDNIEAQASKRFWGAFLPRTRGTTDSADFTDKRKDFKEDINSGQLDSRLRGNDTGEKGKNQSPDNGDGEKTPPEGGTTNYAGFRRETDGGAPPNNLLNYGYMVMRAAVARAICSAGLLPTLGIHHHNKYNAYCLADDVLEPFRGFVEKKVRAMVFQAGDAMALQELTQDCKARLLECLYEPVEIAGFTGPLMVGLHRTAASLQRCLAGEQKEIELPY